MGTTALPPLVQEAINEGLLPELSSATATGYAGVAEHKENKSKGMQQFQGKWWDAARKKARFAPGLYDSAWQAAMARARAKQLFEAARADGLQFPSPRKRKCRAVPAALPYAMAMPLAPNSPALPLTIVHVSATAPAMPMSPAVMMPAAGAAYTPPEAWEVAP